MSEEYTLSHRFIQRRVDRRGEFRTRSKNWSVSAGIGGQVAPERLVSFVRNQWSVCSGIGGQFGPEYAGYRVDNKNYWVATDRYDLSAEDVSMVYKLRWNIETFFGWWKRHLKIYHLIARSEHGLMIQILGGLITYLLLAIYCHEQHHEKVSIKRVRELRIKIKNKAGQSENMPPDPQNNKKPTEGGLYAKL